MVHSGRMSLLRDNLLNQYYAITNTLADKLNFLQTNYILFLLKIIFSEAKLHPDWQKKIFPTSSREIAIFSKMVTLFILPRIVASLYSLGIFFF